MSLENTLQFLVELAHNNNKGWFDANRNWYNQARSAFEDLIADLIATFPAEASLGTLSPKDCVFRINRDVRFSKDKSPYNTAMSAAIGPGGRHGSGQSYYVHIAPGNSFVGSGLFEPDKTALENVRQHIARDAQPLRDILAEPTFVQFFGTIQGDRLKTAPLGYDRNHPAIDLLRYKQLLAVRNFNDAEVLSDGFVDEIGATYWAMQPFLLYLELAANTPHHER